MSIKTYTYEEALQASINFFKGDELAASVWINKYAMKDSYGNLYEKSPDDMHRRLAREFARIENKYPNPMSEDEIFELLRDFKYIIPQGGPMTGIGNSYQIASLSNCFVVGHDKPADSYGGIMKIDEEQVQLMKRRGGVGHDLSHIRPQGSAVLNSALTSTGVVPFMERYSNSTREVAQDGRRGALMLSISIKHPDSEKFIDAKMEQGKVTGANVSVKIDDDFMKAALSGEQYEQKYPINAAEPKVSKMVNAQNIWKKIVHNAWTSAEPGVLFWDTVLRESVADCYADLGYRTVSTNPCGEIPLCPYDSCRLIALNLYSYVENPFTPEAKFNMELFKEHSGKATRLMDDLIDLEMEKIEAILAKIASDPETEDVKRTELELWEKIKAKSLGGRRTGLGITAEGDMLAALSRENLPAFRERLNEYARECLRDVDRQPVVEAECELLPSDMNMEQAGELYYLEPYGVSNPTPLFYIDKVPMVDLQMVGGGKHTRMSLKVGKSIVTAMFFRKTVSDIDLYPGDLLDVIFTLDINEFQGNRNVQMIVKDVRLHATHEEAETTERFMYNTIRNRVGMCLRQQESEMVPLSIAQIIAYIPTRQDFAIVYSTLKKELQMQHEVFSLRALRHDLITNNPGFQITYVKLRFILDILRDLALMGVEESPGEVFTFTYIPAQGKTSLETSRIYKQLLLDYPRE